jgi:hypothetical protein
MTPHLHDTARETLNCLIKRILVDLHVIHDNINLRLLINLFPDLQNAVSSKLYSVLHVLIHLSFVADKHDMRHA